MVGGRGGGGLVGGDVTFAVAMLLLEVIVAGCVFHGDAFVVELARGVVGVVGLTDIVEGGSDGQVGTRRMLRLGCAVVSDGLDCDLESRIAALERGAGVGVRGRSR